MQISARQSAAMSRATTDSFDQRALDFLKRRYPDLAERAGDERMLRLVQHGRVRAPLHGFTSERDVVQYLLVMIHLGPRFDEDPARAPVLRRFLDPASTMPAQMRMGVLIDAAAEEEKRTQERQHAGR
jgi:hypothetical protein